MAHRFVRATPAEGGLAALRERLDDGSVAAMEPFGATMERALERAKWDAEAGEAVWIEEDYCEPPLAMEREAVLDDHFDAIRVVEEDVDPETAWERIAALPKLWEVHGGEATGAHD